MAKRLLLRPIAGPRFGHGHLRRCLALAEAGKARGMAPVLLLGEVDEGVIRVVETCSVEWRRLPPEAGFADEPAAAQALGLGGSAALVLDISNSATMARAAELPAATRGWRSVAGRTAIIDGLLGECLSNAAELDVDLVVLPYAGSHKQELRTKARAARGPDYFVIERGYLGRRPVASGARASARRVLVTAGGSDPAGLTEAFMDALAAIGGRELDVRVVLGPSFDPRLSRRIEGMAEVMAHAVELVRAPQSLVDHIAWCDLALGATGLTKYELAFMGKPSIQLAMDPLHARLNEAFAALGAVRYLGVVGRVAAETMADEIVRLLDHTPRRAEMARRGAEVIDGRGADRILDLLAA